jgi:hypothetical protein
MIGLGLALLLTSVSSTVYAQRTTITIQASQPGRQISPDLFGIFFEDLNYAADGGLYAELIQNRSFEYSPVEQPDWHPLKFWDLEKRGDGDGSIGALNMRLIHWNNPTCALLTVCRPGKGVGIANSGSDGIPLVAGDNVRPLVAGYASVQKQAESVVATARVSGGGIELGFRLPGTTREFSGGFRRRAVPASPVTEVTRRRYHPVKAGFSQSCRAAFRFGRGRFLP